MAINHYKYIELHGAQFSSELGLPYDISADLSANGDKASAFDYVYQRLNIPIVQGRLVFLLGYFKPYVQERDEIGTAEWLTKTLSDSNILNILTILGEQHA